jgi:hypothetical protein
MIFLEFKLNKEIGKGFTGDWASFWPTAHGLTGLRPAWGDRSVTLATGRHAGSFASLAGPGQPMPGQHAGARPGAVAATTTRTVAWPTVIHRWVSCSTPCRSSTHASRSRRRAGSLGLRRTREVGRRATADLHGGDDVQRWREVGRRPAMLRGIPCGSMRVGWR